MVFKLTIECDNDAFSEGNAPVEVARILRETAERVESGDIRGHFRTLRDVNGNDVGRAAFKNDDGSPANGANW